MGSHCKAVALAALIATTTTALADTAPAPEFGGQDVTALADRQHVATDCKVDWQAKDGKRYCFASDASKAAFLKAPDETLDKATDMVAAADVAHVGTAMEKFSSEDAAALDKVQDLGLVERNFNGAGSDVVCSRVDVGKLCVHPYSLSRHKKAQPEGRACCC